MKFSFVVFFAAFLSLVSLMGCGSQSEADPRESGESQGKEEGREESPSGASFKPGKGVMLTDETRRILGIETVEVTQEKLPRVVRFNVQIFGETHRFAHPDLDEAHTGCDIHGSGFLPPDKAAEIEPKQPVMLLTGDGETLGGFVVKTKKAVAHGETEIIVGVAEAESRLKEGEFVSVTISLPREEDVLVVPSTALLKTVEGAFVYTVNGDAYYRTAVRPGSEANDKIEITDGLYLGDEVVTKSVQTLWIIELRATKGGGHSH